MAKKDDIMFLTLEKECIDVDEFIKGVLILGYTIIKDNVKCDKIMLMTSKKLNKQLADTPENENVWKKIYKEIPACILHHTARIESANGKSEIIVYTDLYSERGKRQAANIRRKLIEKNF